MIAELEDLDRQINAILREVTSMTTGLREQQAHWTPRAGLWSIGQCLDHISISTRLYLPEMDAAIRRGREQRILSNGPFTYSAFGRWLMQGVEPPPRLRVRTAKAFVPLPQRNVTEIAADFHAAHEELRDRIK